MIKALTRLSTRKRFLVDSATRHFATLQKALTERSCFFCHAPTHEALGICAGCQLDLPWNTNACRICSEPMPSQLSGQVTCGKCLTSQPAFDRCLTAFTFEFPVRQAIHQLKYSQQCYWSRPLSACLHRVIDQQSPLYRPEVLIPVPMDRAKKRIRKINQSEEIAKRVGKHMRLPVDGKSVRKIRATSAQSTLSKRERRQNLRGSFEVIGKPRYQHVAIVDDVITTGATAETLARLLKKAGIEEVSIWCIARTPTPAHIRV